MNPILISIDDLKKSFPGYHPAKAENFHTAAVKIADKYFAQSLKKLQGKLVILMSGGSASGKTEFLSEYLDNFDGIIYDGTLSTIEGAKIKIRKIQTALKKASVYAVFPDDLRRAFSAFLHRDRKFSDTHFYRTHSGSRKTLLWIAESFPDVEIKIYQSFYKNETLLFREFVFESRLEMIEFLKKNQYTETEILKNVTAL